MEVDSEAIEQFVYFDIVATVLGKFEVDLPRQSWLRGKLPLFNQLVVATVLGHGGGGHSSELQTKSQIRCSGVGGGGGEGGLRGGGCGYVVVVIGLLAKVSLRYVVFSVIQLLVVSLASNKSRHGSQKCCRVVSSFAAEVCRLCCRVVISLKLS